MGFPVIFWSSWFAYTAVCILSAALVTNYGIAVVILSGLTQYFLADDNKNSGKTNSETPNPPPLQRRKHKKQGVWDEKESQVMRILVHPFHVMARPQFKLYEESIMFLTIGICSLSICGLFHAFVPKEYSEIALNGDLVALLLGSVSLWRLVSNTAQVEFEKSSVRKSDFQISVTVGIISGVLLFGLLSLPQGLGLDFEFETPLTKAGNSIAAHLNSGLGKEESPYPSLYIPLPLFKIFLSFVAAAISAILLPSSLKFSRSLYFSLSEEHRDLRVEEYKWWTRILLHLNFVLPIILSFLWVSPMITIFQESPKSKTEAEKEFSVSLGLSEELFSKLRLGLLLLWAVLHLASFRIHIQADFNCALNAWYNELHGRMDPNFELIRQRLLLSAKGICTVALQFLIPGAMTLLLLGLSLTRSKQMEDEEKAQGFFLPPLLLRTVFVFFSWWTCAIWGIENLVLFSCFRFGQFQIL